MATLTCKDGTEVKISDETEQELRDKFGPKKEFEPIEVCHLKISAARMGVHFVERHTGKFICSQTISEAHRTIAAIQKAIDFSEDQ